MSSSRSQFPTADQSHAFFGLGFDPLSDKVAFPQLSDAELAEVALFGERRYFAKDEALVRRTLTRAGWQVLVLLCHKTICRV